MPPKDISLSAEERRAFDRLFENADTEQLGVLTGDKAVPFFEASELPGQVLGEIWALADDENTGFLTKEAFYVVCRLIGYAQRGQQPSQALMTKSGPLPYFKGMHVPGLPEQRPSATPLGTPQKKAPSQSAAFMSISPDDKAKYTRLFINSQPIGGLLDGEKAREIFTKSRLPNEKLGQIWNLADTQSRGALDVTDFVIAMHLIHGSMNGTISQLPDTLPVSLYAQAASGSTAGIPSMPTSPIRAQATGSPLPSALYPQSTGSSLLNRTSVGGGALSPAQRAMSLGQSQSGGLWAIDPVEKAQSDQFFDMLDTSRQGVLQGDIAVPFFVQSGLPEETLAQIWDLSDIRKEGTLTKEEFAVARRLVMDVLAGKPLPEQLDQSMIPPSLRAIAQQMQNQPQQSEVQRDLFSLMDDDEPSQLPPAAIASGAAAFQPLPAAARVASPAPIQPTPTGGSARSLPPASQPVRSGTASRQDSTHHRSPPPPVPAHRTHSTHTIHPASPTHSTTPSHNFFDNTPAEEKGNQFSSSSIEVGNLQNQVRETQKSVSSLRQERTALSSSVAKTEAEIDELKSALAQAKAAFDTESTNMTNLETRFKTGSEELKKLRQELIHAESELSALREQKAETEQNILKDKEEIRELKIKLKVSNDEVVSLKETLEKLRKESRQQKGLVVVSKKQLATSEADKEKVSKSIAEEREKAHTVATASPSVNEAARAIPLPDSKGASPAASVHSNRSTNPFFAHTSAARVTSPLQAPSITAQDAAESDPFGMASQPMAAPQPVATARTAGFGFDDDFDSTFNPAPATDIPAIHENNKQSTEPKASVPPPQADADFDAAFADFDKPVPATSGQGTSNKSKDVADAVATDPSIQHYDTEAPANSNVEKVAEDKVTDLTGSAAVGAAVGALVGAGAVAATQIKDVLSPNEASDQTAATPLSMQPYESRQVAENTDDDQDDGDEELAPIRDVQQDESDSDSDSDSETDEEPVRATHQGNVDNAGPFASAEDEPEEPESIITHGQGDNGSVDANSSVRDEPIHTGRSLTSDPFPGAFPAGGASRPASSVGEADDHFEDAHTEQQERSASPHQAVLSTPHTTSAADTDISQDTEPLKSSSLATFEGGNALATDASKSGPTLGFDDAFDSPFKAMTPASNDSPAPARAADHDAETHSGTASMDNSAGPMADKNNHNEAVAPVLPASADNLRDSDDFDDFEDLAPARIEDTPSVATSAPTSARNPDFDSNFDDDFGFDNQTFSHSNAQQPAAATQSKDGGSGGFDDNFDAAFVSPAAAATQAPNSQAPPLPSRAPAVGFDDDFFSTPATTQATSTGQPDPYLQQQYQHQVLPQATSPQSRAEHDLPSSGQHSVTTQQPSDRNSTSFAPPAGPPPQQQPAQTAAPPTLPARTEADGDLPQVKELVGMGFNRTQAIAALEDNQFDLERAANALLSVNN